MIVEGEGRAFAVDEAHLLRADPEMLGPRLAAAGASEFKRVFRSVFVAEMQCRQFPSGGLERPEIGGEWNARQRLGQVVPEALTIRGRAQHAVDVIKDAVLRDRVVAIAHPECAQGPIRYIVDALGLRFDPREFGLRFRGLLKAIAGEILAVEHELDVRHRIHHQNRERLGRADAGDADGQVFAICFGEDAVHLVLVVDQHIVDVTNVPLKSQINSFA